jgi:DNA-binding response OmpR family regulator
MLRVLHLLLGCLWNVDTNKEKNTKLQVKEKNIGCKIMRYHVRTRILIIDDEPDITLAFRKALRDKGFEQVKTINDPTFALKNFKAGSFDLLIIDIVMPEMDGFDLYEEIRKIDNKVRVCFITAFEINYQALRAIFPTATTTDDLGCFIRKPVDIDDLVKRINAEIQ